MKRPFQSLRLSQGPDPIYDAVIAGAGIGGLICANLLARQGLRVLLIEQHYMVGGYCSTFRRQGYTFDAASHFYPLLGNPTTLTGKLLQDLGITTGWIKMDPVDHFHLPDGTQFSVPADFDTYLSKLKDRFPRESQALDQFFEHARKAYLYGLLHYFRGRETALLDPYRDLTVTQMLNRHFRNLKLKLLLTADCPHWGGPPSRTSFVFDSMLRLSYFLGNYYPKGGSQIFADELAQQLVAHGGHILMNTAVKRIVVEGGRACGVDIETGPIRRRTIKRVRAETVISNADMLQTLEHWLGPEHVDPNLLTSIRALKPTFSCFLTHIGLKGVPTETLRKIQGYYWDTWDPDEVGTGGHRFKLFVPTLFEPQMAPPGGHILIVQKAMDLNYQGISDWAVHKAGTERFIMDHLEDILPGIQDHIVVKMSATAKTAFAYTGNHQGAMLGWEMSPDQLGHNRPDIEGPIPNLYFTGHWTKPGGGITPAIVSAMQVAQRIAKSTAIAPVPAFAI